MSNRNLVVTVFAKDRPGIVRAISDAVLANNANWLESSLSRLCGQFTGIVHLDVADSDYTQLHEALLDLAEQDIQITVHESASLTPEEGEVNGLQILVEANDRPGIVKEISDALARENINLDNIDTEVESASMAGYPLFRAHLFLAMPDDISESDLEEILEDVSDDLMVSILSE